MNLDEAYQLTLDKLEELINLGIQVESQIPKYIQEGDDQKIAELTKEYPAPNFLPLEKWRIVQLIAKSHEEEKEVRNVQKSLLELGIYFDGGSDSGRIDWNLDWSFRLAEPLSRPEHN